MDKLLNMLVIFINERVRACKISLKTEEKSREIAYLQGRITGYRTLLYFLKAHFELTTSFIEDSGESPADIKSLTNGEIRELSITVEGLGISDNWANLIAAINQR
ncbi:MAG: hypothetical protein LBH15_01850 [Treponema sp.]|jgi:uncharacterized protein YunC (DUF1805 family)|nr:hypothetical protein [Treponema sp.]